MAWRMLSLLTCVCRHRISQRVLSHSVGDRFLFILGDSNDEDRLESIVKNEKITWLIHNAAFLSATSEIFPKQALKLNTQGLHNVMSIAEQYKLKVFVPSSIAAFGPDTPLVKTPDFTVQRPRGIYGIGKVYAELLGEYYFQKRGVDFRTLRYPGIISWKTLPGGGTTDYAVDIFHAALKGKVYDCYLKPDTELPMMYMPDCIKATVDLLEADPARLTHRTYNVTSFSVTPKILHAAIQKVIPSFKIQYMNIDPLRQGFADSWPKSLDDSDARRDWKWKEAFGLDAMVKDMLDNLPKMLNNK
jgi:threonine 3-dehydrogenase